MKKLKVAVIGCGNISVMHLDSIMAFDDIELVAVCDIKEERAVAASNKYGGNIYTDYNIMFEKEALDAVQIRQFYNALQGKEELEISGKEALKIQNIICQIYQNNDNTFLIK